MIKICIVEGCEKARRSKYYCPNHWRRLHLYGSVHATKTAKHHEAAEWLKSNASYEGDDCLKWPFGNYKNGYGCVHVGRKSSYAHREMCLLAYGPAPEGKPHAAHSCGNGHLGCVNPKHLRWSSPSENMLEKRKHGTAPIGENCGAAKLTWEKVREIRSDKVSTHRQLAAKYGVSKHTIYHVRRGTTWNDALFGREIQVALEKLEAA